jgi:hypothetical protein
LAWALLAVAALGAAVMVLWNALLPHLFGLPVIGFWQALGLLVLSKLLLGGLRGGRGARAHWRTRMAERWAQMSDEERTAWREGLRHCGGRCGPAQTPAP